MGEVYLAENTKFSPPRKEVLKGLLPQYANDGEARARFKREADALASVNHPGVVTVYEVGECEEEPFIAMEFVEGKTLKSLNTENQFSLERSLELAVEMGEALREAHQKGVMHRDIKPDNVLIKTNGRIKLIDFGLAKLSDSAKLTHSGTTAGTLGYMSPEQVRGEELDFRTDIFSFGVVLYELITSRHPFEAKHQAAIQYSIEHEEPAPLRRFNSQVGSDLQTVMDKALAKERENRFQNMEELLAELRRMKGQSGGHPDSPRPSPGTKRSVAVLFFENLSPEPDSDYFSDGITEDIITILSWIEGLRVASSNAVLPHKGKPVDLPVLCSRMNLDAVAQGSVHKIGNQLKITAKLVDNQGFLKWQQQYRREWGEVFKLQEEIAKDIALAMKIELLERDYQNISRKYQVNPNAYERYLKGRKCYYKFTRQDLLAAIRFFKDALEIDSDYALAYAGLADSYMAMVDRGYETDQHYLKMGEEVALKALDIDTTCPEVYKALGTIYYKLWRFKKSKKQLLKALDLKPDYAVARANLAGTHLYLGEFDKAEKEYRLACEQDPSLTFVLWLLARFYLGLNRFSEAEQCIAPVLESEESAAVMEIAHYVLSRIYGFQGKFDQALQHMRRYVEVEPDDPAGASGLASLFAAKGEREKARAMLEATLKKSPWDEDIIENLILTYAFLEEKDSVYDWIKKAMDENKILWVFLEYNPHLQKLRSKEKFQQLLREVKEKTFGGD